MPTTASVSFRTDDDMGVYNLVSETEAFVSPPILGWVTVYERESGDGDLEALTEIAASGSEALGCAALALMVLEDEHLVYLLFESGELQDEYASDPDLFGEDEDDSEEIIGDEAALLPYAVPGATEAAIREVLDADLPANDRRGALAKLLGIENAQFSYDLLVRIAEGGEATTVLGWEMFMQAPPLDDEDLPASTNGVHAS